MKKRLMSLLLCLVMVFTMLVGCGTSEEAGDDAEATESKGTLTVGVGGEFYPFCFSENDEIQGFEIDVLTEVAKRAGYEVEFTVSDFTGLIGMLDAGQVDTVGYSVAITDERVEKYDFSDPYVYSNYNVVTLKDSELKTIEDFVGKKVGVVMGGMGEVKLNELCEAENLDIEVVGYEGTAAMDEDVMLGRIDGRLGPQIQTMANIEKNDLDLVVTDATVFFETAGYPFPKDGAHDEMLADVNAALTAMREDGTLTEISMKWFNIDATQAK